VTWPEAKATCAGYGGNLASIDQFKGDTIFSLFSYGNWIDLSGKSLSNIRVIIKFMLQKLALFYSICQ